MKEDPSIARGAGRRPARALRVSFVESIGAVQALDCEMLLLDQALDELAVLDPPQARIVGAPAPGCTGA